MSTAVKFNIDINAAVIQIHYVTFYHSDYLLNTGRTYFYLSDV